ncbi:MAG: cation-transporting P-type ATPase [Synechococcaceae cyanobacterium]|nr:cation-transporting P-type ATPase [Synechococcaceae cyanobacterium]
MSQRPAWQELTPQQCLEALQSGGDGLTSAEAAARLARLGPNRLELPPGRSTVGIVLDQFGNPMLILLLGVAGVSGLLAFLEEEVPRDPIAILLIVLLNAVLGAVQESRAQKALQALRQMVQPRVRVCRDGLWRSLPAEELVPGDRLRVQEGDRLAADARLLEGSGLGVREAALTGESDVVEKRADLLLAADTPLAERRNCLHQGTEVVRGRGVAVVTATGMATELGRIAGLLETAGGGVTPLQQRLDGLARLLVAGALALVAVVVPLGWWWGRPPLELLELALSTAVAVVPEGLPAVVTVSLAIGTQRMVRRSALVRRLAAVEALGSVTVICTDKTGTLTQNRQVVEDLACSGDPARALLLTAAALCNDAELRRGADGAWQGWGDPTEAALLEAAHHAGLDPAVLRERHPRRAEIPFSSERRRMVVWVEDPAGSLAGQLGGPAGAGDGAEPLLLISKGAPEVVIGGCDRWLAPAGAVSLTARRRAWWLEQARRLSAGGLRVLAVACAPRSTPAPGELGGQVLLGLAAQRDPPRREVTAAVARCRTAGIRPVMITGDHPLTAQAIAAAIGLADLDAQVVEGRRLETLGDDALRRLVARCSVYARVPPEQKLRIVKALQAGGEVVAMTGDGVNDAPALRQAHIGVAMGLSGTEVTREAADIVLLDDDFTTIVKAVEEGRRVYANIRRFVRYILASNLGELVTLGAAPLLGVPLTPLQILWMNLVTDGVPALALALGPGEEDLMERPPLEPGESIFARGLGAAIARIGVVFAVLVIALMLVAAAQGAPWRTMAFTTLCLAQMTHALSARSDRPLLRDPPLANPWLLGAVVFTTVLQLAVLYVPPLADFLALTPLPGRDLALCAGVSLLFLLYLELEKLIRLRGSATSRS